MKQNFRILINDSSQVTLIKNLCNLHGWVLETQNILGMKTKYSSSN